MKYKVIVAGGRDLQKKKPQVFVHLALAEELEHFGVTHPIQCEIVSGGAPGADTMGEIFARATGSKIVPFLADWNNLAEEPCKIRVNKYGRQYNCLAGFNRNTRMLKYGNRLIAFWDGESTGTKDMIDKARAEYGPDNVRIINY